MKNGLPSPGSEKKKHPSSKCNRKKKPRAPEHLQAKIVKGKRTEPRQGPGRDPKCMRGEGVGGVAKKAV